MMNRSYIEAARLLVRVAPLVFVDEQFGLKGGTAINLFLRDMPRLSVDLDLVFVDHTVGREDALARINTAVRSAADRLRPQRFDVYVPEAADDGETKLMVRNGAAEVKVEINTVMRGTVHAVRRANLTPLARDTLLADLEIPVLAPEGVYGGKLVAALDRQHPRDLFDVMELFKHEGITPGIRRAFVVYLACHNRPVHEVLFPEFRDIQMDYERTFVGMTAQPTALSVLLETRDRMIAELHASLDTDERRFLLSLVKAEPEWELLDNPHVSELPAVRWKLQNLQRLQREQPKQFELQYTSLASRLEQ
jgi:predicted nucleotidyltransferase component of viral defense system